MKVTVLVNHAKPVKASLASKPTRHNVLAAHEGAEADARTGMA